MEPLPLKDIHLPETVGWWPPAYGWWLAVCLVVLSLLLCRYIFKRLTRKTAVKSAQKRLKQIRLHSKEKRQTLTNLSELLRRTAISIDGRAEVAGLQGEAWLQYLDRCLPDASFSQGVGRCLSDAHYRPTLPDDTDIEALLALCERWLKQRGKKA